VWNECGGMAAETCSRDGFHVEVLRLHGRIPNVQQVLDEEKPFGHVFIGAEPCWCSD